MKNGETVVEGWPEGSPEGIIKQAVTELLARGEAVTEATVHHWPGSGSDVLDNLLTGKRTGQF